jgi:hypothetical protein
MSDEKTMDTVSRVDAIHAAMALSMGEIQHVAKGKFNSTTSTRRVVRFSRRTESTSHTESCHTSLSRGK